MDSEQPKKKPTERVITKRVPATKPVFTPGVIIAILLIGGVVVLIVVAALTYKPPSDETKKPESDPEKKDPPPPTTKPGTTPPPITSPKPPIGWEWVGDAISGTTFGGARYDMVTSWVEPAGSFKSIRCDIKLVDTVQGGLSVKDKTFQVPLFKYIQPFATLLLEQYGNTGIAASKEYTDVWYAQNGVSWTMLADARTLEYLDKKAPNGQRIPVATPTLVATFSGSALNKIPPGNISFVAKNLFQ